MHRERLTPLQPRVAPGEAEPAGAGVGGNPERKAHETLELQEFCPPKTPSLQADGSQPLSDDDVAVDAGGGWRVYALALAVAAAVQFLAGLVMVETAADGWPSDESEYVSSSSIAWRQLRSVLLSGVRGILAMIPFAYTLAIGPTRVAWMSVAISALFVARGVFAASLRAGDGDEGAVFSVIGALFFVPIFLVPLWLVRGAPRRDEVATGAQGGLMHTLYPPFAVITGVLLALYVVFEGAFLVLVVLLLFAIPIVLIVDRRTRMSPVYVACLSLIAGLCGSPAPPIPLPSDAPPQGACRCGLCRRRAGRNA